MNSRNLTLEAAKDRVTILDLWTKFNLPGTPSKSCRCPWREDRKPSFSVSNDGRLFNDFATGEGGDAVDFLAKITGLSCGSACRLLMDFAGAVPRHIPTPGATTSPKPKPSYPPLDKGTIADLATLSKLRNIPPAGLQWAVERGTLRFTTPEKHLVRTWVVTDSEGVNAQARRLDGIGWRHLAGGPKAWTLPGSWATWPLGIREAESFSTIALVEGGPDFLAGHALALPEQDDHSSISGARFAPVGMLGAGLRIHESALPLFRGKRVRIYPHNDDAGRRAATQWAEQLASVGVTADAFSLAGLVRADGKPAKDLNDCLLLNKPDLDEVGKELMV